MFFSEFNYKFYFLINAVMKCYSQDGSYCRADLRSKTSESSLEEVYLRLEKAKFRSERLICGLRGLVLGLRGLISGLRGLNQILRGMIWGLRG